jgi:hypothetical protein
MSIFISIFSLGSTPITDSLDLSEDILPGTISSNISVEYRPNAEVPLYSDAPKTYYKGWDHSTLSAYTRRLVEQYSSLPVDIPNEVKAVQ